VSVDNLFFASDQRLRASWRFVLFVVLFYVAMFVVMAFCIPLMAWVLGGLSATQESFLVRGLLQGSGMSGSALVVAWLLLRTVDGRPFRSLGLWFYPHWRRDCVVGLLWGSGLLTVVVVPLMASGYYQLQVDVSSVGQACWALSLGVATLLLPAAAEEILFRGYPFQRLVEAWGGIGAVLFVSILFGVVHLRNPAVTVLSTTNTVLIGALLSVLYLRTKGLWLPIGVHFSWNFVLACVYSLPVSGFLLEDRLFNVEVSGPAWLSGGAYGPEGSVLTTGVSIVAIAWALRTERWIVASEVSVGRKPTLESTLARKFEKR